MNCFVVSSSVTSMQLIIIFFTDIATTGMVSSIGKTSVMYCDIKE